MFGFGLLVLQSKAQENTTRKTQLVVAGSTKYSINLEQIIQKPYKSWNTVNVINNFQKKYSENDHFSQIMQAVR